MNFNATPLLSFTEDKDISKKTTILASLGALFASPASLGALFASPPSLADLKKPFLKSSASGVRDPEDHIVTVSHIITVDVSDFHCKPEASTDDIEDFKTKIKNRIDSIVEKEYFTIQEHESSFDDLANLIHKISIDEEKDLLFLKAIEDYLNKDAIRSELDQINKTKPGPTASDSAEAVETWWQKTTQFFADHCPKSFNDHATVIADDWMCFTGCEITGCVSLVGSAAAAIWCFAIWKSLVGSAAAAIWCFAKLAAAAESNTLSNDSPIFLELRPSLSLVALYLAFDALVWGPRVGPRPIQ